MELEVGRVGFWGEGSPEVPGEKPLGASEKNYNKLNPDVAWTRRDSNPGHTTLTTVITRGDSAYERGGDARRKFWIKPLKETHLGVAQAFFDP